MGRHQYNKYNIKTSNNTEKKLSEIISFA